MKRFESFVDDLRSHPKRIGFVAATVTPLLAAIVQHLVSKTFTTPGVWFFSGLPLFLSAVTGGLLPTLLAAALTLTLQFSLFVDPAAALADHLMMMRVSFFCVAAFLFGMTGETLLRQRLALRRNITFLEAISKFAADFAYEVSIIDGRPCLTDVTDSVEELTGYTAAELRSADGYARLVRETEMSPQLAKIFAARAAGKPVRGEVKLYRKDGTALWVEVHSGPGIVRKNALRFVAAARDITERKNAEEALLSHVALLDAINSSAHDVIYLKDTQGRHVYANPACCAALGAAPSDILGRRVDEFLLNSSLGERLSRGDAEVMRTRKAQVFEETIVIAGQLAVYQSAKAPWLDATGKVIGVSGISRDITARKALEQRALEADERKGRFIAMLGHELRNPLAPLSAGIELLRNTHGASAHSKTVLDRMHRQMEVLVRLLDDMLDVARIDQGRLEVRPSWQRTKDILDTAVSGVVASTESRKQQIIVNTEKAPVFVFADPVRLAQGITNLVSNASKFSPHGSTITVDIAVDDNSVTFAVTDEGAGVAVDDKTRIFEMFAQGEGAKHLEGMGIGLALVKEICTAHGGSVNAERSSTGAGSRFVIELPLPSRVAEEVADAQGSGSTGAPARSTQGPSLLVVDDNVNAAEGLSDLLVQYGCKVEVRHDGAAALATLSEQKFDAAILDLGMPGMDGFELARRIRASSVSRGIRLIALSGWASSKDRVKSKDAGFDAHLAKPATVEVLLDAIGSPAGVQLKTDDSAISK
ncbi:PAS domain S-box protein [Paraburkholderia sp. UCT31]|uniref:hybrid sensor histidine kinase/response regulator n=1 Tax=Paraburkholderia sp. UCT31 TaxID=2615209 RepID=UPI0016557995|nr:PAS domain S-box protein [Paraburkholderia sp. UCT31]MBC8737011.1 PAS domain S-box protein [Paraburkholderia sp. UCT31]